MEKKQKKTCFSKNHGGFKICFYSIPKDMLEEQILLEHCFISTHVHN